MKSFGVIILLIFSSFRVLAGTDTTIHLPLKIFCDTTHLSISTTSCYIDSTNSLNFKKIQKCNFNRPYLEFYNTISEKQNKNIYWLKFHIRNNSEEKRSLHLYCGSIDFIHLYFVQSNRHIKILEGGFLHIPDNNLSYEEKMAGTLPLILQPHTQGEVYVSLRQKTQKLDFDGIEIYDQNAFYSSFFQDYEKDRYFTVFQLLFQGFILCLLLLILYQWLIIRRKEYFYFFLYLLIISLYFLSKYETLFGVELLFSRFPLLIVYLGKILLIVPYLLYLKFVRGFLEIPLKYKTLNRWIIGLEYFLIVYTLFDFGYILLTFNQPVETKIFMVVILPVFTLSVAFMVYLFRKRHTLIYIILVGSLFAVLASILGVFPAILAPNIISRPGFHTLLILSQISIIIETSIFTAGLSYKRHLAEKEKIKSHQLLIEQLKANEILQSKMQNIRNKIAQDLHDDIGSTLSSISIMSDLILKDKNNGKSLGMIQEIKDNSVTLLEKMDDIIWSINPKNDSLERLLLRIKRFASSLFEARNIDYSIIIQENIEQIKFSMEYRQHIYLILKESINNLVKYSQATNAIVEVVFDNQIFEITVKDNGIGFIMSDTFEGDGIQSMKNRANLMKADLIFNTGFNKGTEILLKVNLN